MIDVHELSGIDGGQGKVLATFLNLMMVKKILRLVRHHAGLPLSCLTRRPLVTINQFHHIS